MVDMRVPACQISLATSVGVNLTSHPKGCEVELVLFGSSKVASPAPKMSPQRPSRLGKEPIRVLLGLKSPMDCQLLRTALRRSRKRLEVVASAVSKNDVLHSFSRGHVDVALINEDLEDGRMAGLEILPELYAADAKTPVVMLFDNWQDDLILHAFRAGAKGVYCRLEKNLEMLWRCINAVHKGQIWANSMQLHLVLSVLRNAAPIPLVASPGKNLLAERETQVANLVAEGLPNRAIAQKLGITDHTVSNYLFRVYNKLGISSRVELVLYIMKQREVSAIKTG